MEAIDEAEADLGNDAANDLDKIDDFEAILNMPKQQKVPFNPMKRQESIARKLKEQEHAKQMAIMKAQEEKAAQQQREKEALIAQKLAEEKRREAEEREKAILEAKKEQA